MTQLHGIQAPSTETRRRLHPSFQKDAEEERLGLGGGGHHRLKSGYTTALKYKKGVV